ncbi:MAG: Minf_1886 family protein [Planctomycetota bacterium]
MTQVIDLKAILDQAGGYSPRAYEFLRDGLAHAVRNVHGDEVAMRGPSEDDDSRHVSGQDLCLALRDYAIERYGLLARTVLSRWNIHRTDDFGNIVFAMVDAGLMRKTDDDTPDDFRGVFDFDEEFGHSLADTIGSE